MRADAVRLIKFGKSSMLTTDILIVGSGVVGLSIAKEINSRHPALKICVIEKEDTLASHASGRNSGIIHAGFYYTPDTMKARFTVEGNRLLTDYCLYHNIPINRCGKIVVAKDEKEIETLYELKKRGDKNGVSLEVVDEDQLKDLEPNAKTYYKALYSPTTSTVNPREIVEHIGNNLKTKNNVNILFNERFLKREDTFTVITNNRKIEFKYLINTAGLYSDKVAKEFGIGSKYTIIPFKGLYLEYRDDNLINRNIYPVPDLNNPFLGVHFTKTVDGKVKAGPTAIPALWRENYAGLSNYRIDELFEIILVEAKLLYFDSFNFRKIALEETRKYWKRYFIQQASRLVKKIDKNKFGNYLTPGIRAQLFDKEKRQLIMDFVVEYGENSAHMLNAVSPAFTCAFSFSKFIVDEIEKRLTNHPVAGYGHLVNLIV
jgi:L-2-hydroxyglutarate oxidase LhgO